MSCPYPGCSGTLVPHSDGCPVCHRRVVFCPSCERPNRALAKMCRACGKPVGEQVEWPVYRRNPGFDSFSPAPLDFDSISPSQQFERLWPPVTLGKGEEVLAPPVVEHGLLIVCTRKGVVYVLNRFTGEQLATLPSTEGLSFALVSGDTLAIAGGNRVATYNLREAFRSWIAGHFKLAEVWRKTLDSGSVVHPLNALTPKSLLVCSGGPGKVTVHCLDTETGETRWLTPVVIPTGASAPVCDDQGNAYLLGSDRKVHRIASGSGTVEASASASNPLRIDIAPTWMDSILFFFDEEGALYSCRTDVGGMTPARVSELTLLGVKGFAVSPRGILVSHGRGLTKLSLGGQLVWSADPSMYPMSSSPVLAGDCGMGVTLERSVIYLCDFKGTFLRFHQFPSADDQNLAPPAFAGDVLYTCSHHGELNALRVVTAL